VAEIVYPPVIGAIKLFWRYLGLQFTFAGEAHVPRKGGAIMAINHVGYTRETTCAFYGEERSF
jgi:1-acyl-sn-glycerol-3-phosphate acyltransferase